LSEEIKRWQVPGAGCGVQGKGSGYRVQGTGERKEMSAAALGLPLHGLREQPWTG